MVGKRVKERREKEGVVNLCHEPSPEITRNGRPLLLLALINKLSLPLFTSSDLLQNKNYMRFVFLCFGNHFLTT